MALWNSDFTALYQTHCISVAIIVFLVMYREDPFRLLVSSSLGENKISQFFDSALRHISMWDVWICVSECAFWWACWCTWSFLGITQLSIYLPLWHLLKFPLKFQCSKLSKLHNAMSLYNFPVFPSMDIYWNRWSFILWTNLETNNNPKHGVFSQKRNPKTDININLVTKSLSRLHSITQVKHILSKLGTIYL